MKRTRDTGRERLTCTKNARHSERLGERMNFRNDRNDDDDDASAHDGEGEREAQEGKGGWVASLLLSPCS